MNANDEISVDQIMERIRQEVAQRKAAAATSSIPVLDTIEPVCERQGAPSKATVDEGLSGDLKTAPKHRASYSIHDFSKYHDAEFIRNAYHGILKRDPDPHGYNYYLTKLRQGDRKGEILGRMRYSKEGKQRNVAVRGLLPLFLAEISFNIPVLGYFLEIAASIAMLPKRLRYIRQWESFTNIRFAQHINATNVLSAGFERNATQIQNILRTKADTHLVDEVKGRLATKVDASAVEGIRGRLATKADAGVVFELQKQLETKAESRVVEQIEEQVQTKADVELVERMRTQISTKADARSIEEVRKDLATKADAGFVNGLKRQLEVKAESKVVEQISRRLQSKADVDLVDRMMTQLSTKADARAVEEVRRQLTTKADTGAMEEVRGQLGMKADASVMEEVRGQLATKADASAVEEVRRQLTTKADTGAMEEVRGQLATKADAGAVEEVRGQLTTKADAGVIEEVRGQLATKAEAGAVDEVREQSAARIAAAVEAINKQLAAKVEADALNSLRSDLNNKADAEVLNAISKGLQDISRQTRDHKLFLLDQQRRLTLLLEEARKRFPEPIAAEQLESMINEEEHILDAMYVTFEDQFRGTREDIKQRLRIYLPYVVQVVGKSESAIILDVGCGRGEWLEVLRENNYRAKGVDRNRVMIQQCNELDLDVTESDALDYLKNQRGNRFKVITGFHIVEHIPFKAMLSLLDESLRLLKPGGMIIFETPNPENLIVGSCNFYLDPTHRQPIPPPQLLFMVEQRGFVKAQIMRLHPLEDFLDRSSDHGYNEKIQNLFSNAQDYSVIAYKPLTSSSE
jgi:2-polyprenyl-3-methyl-5-hydroxy-6-metoxy-1,4-benzoquinol methylase